MENGKRIIRGYVDGAGIEAEKDPIEGDNAWLVHKPDKLDYIGEIVVKETDLVGTQDSPCHFTECDHRIGDGEPVATCIKPPNIGSSDPNNWGYKLVYPPPPPPPEP